MNNAMKLVVQAALVLLLSIFVAGSTLSFETPYMWFPGEYSSSPADDIRLFLLRESPVVCLRVQDVDALPGGDLAHTHGFLRIITDSFRTFEWVADGPWNFNATDACYDMSRVVSSSNSYLYSVAVSVLEDLAYSSEDATGSGSLSSSDNATLAEVWMCLGDDEEFRPCQLFTEGNVSRVTVDEYLMSSHSSNRSALTLFTGYAGQVPILRSPSSFVFSWQSAIYGTQKCVLITVLDSDGQQVSWYTIRDTKSEVRLYSNSTGLTLNGMTINTTGVPIGFDGGASICCVDYVSSVTDFHLELRVADADPYEEMSAIGVSGFSVDMSDSFIPVSATPTPTPTPSATPVYFTNFRIEPAGFRLSVDDPRIRILATNDDGVVDVDVDGVFAVLHLNYTGAEWRTILFNEGRSEFVHFRGAEHPEEIEIVMEYYVPAEFVVPAAVLENSGSDVHSVAYCDRSNGAATLFSTKMLEPGIVLDVWNVDDRIEVGDVSSVVIGASFPEVHDVVERGDPWTWSIQLQFLDQFNNTVDAVSLSRVEYEVLFTPASGGNMTSYANGSVAYIGTGMGNITIDLDPIGIYNLSILPLGNTTNISQPAILVEVVAATPSVTVTASPSTTASSTVSVTVSGTSSLTSSTTSTVTVSTSSTESVSPTVSSTSSVSVTTSTSSSISATQSVSASTTSTVSQTLTATSSSSATSTVSSSSTSSATSTESVSVTSTSTRTETTTLTSTSSISSSVTSTASLSSTVTPTSSISSSITSTLTSTPSVSVSSTVSATVSVTVSPDVSGPDVSGVSVRWLYSSDPYFTSYRSLPTSDAAVTDSASSFAVTVFNISEPQTAVCTFYFEWRVYSQSTNFTDECRQSIREEIDPKDFNNEDYRTTLLLGCQSDSISRQYDGFLDLEFELVVTVEHCQLRNSTPVHFTSPVPYLLDSSLIPLSQLSASPPTIVALHTSSDISWSWPVYDDPQSGNPLGYLWEVIMCSSLSIFPCTAVTSNDVSLAPFPDEYTLDILGSSSSVETVLQSYNLITESSEPHVILTAAEAAGVYFYVDLAVLNQAMLWSNVSFENETRTHGFLDVSVPEVDHIRRLGTAPSTSGYLNITGVCDHTIEYLRLQDPHPHASGLQNIYVMFNISSAGRHVVFASDLGSTAFINPGYWVMDEPMCDALLQILMDIGNESYAVRVSAWVDDDVGHNSSKWNLFDTLVDISVPVLSGGVVPNPSGRWNLSLSDVDAEAVPSYSPHGMWLSTHMMTGFADSSINISFNSNVSDVFVDAGSGLVSLEVVPVIESCRSRTCRRRMLQPLWTYWSSFTSIGRNEFVIPIALAPPNSTVYLAARVLNGADVYLPYWVRVNGSAIVDHSGPALAAAPSVVFPSLNRTIGDMNVTGVEGFHDYARNPMLNVTWLTHVDSISPVVHFEFGFELYSPDSDEVFQDGTAVDDLFSATAASTVYVARSRSVGTHLTLADTALWNAAVDSLELNITDAMADGNVTDVCGTAMRLWIRAQNAAGLWSNASSLWRGNTSVVFGYGLEDGMLCNRIRNLHPVPLVSNPSESVVLWLFDTFPQPAHHCMNPQCRIRVTKTVELSLPTRLSPGSNLNTTVVTLLEGGQNGTAGNTTSLSSTNITSSYAFTCDMPSLDNMIELMENVRATVEFGDDHETLEYLDNFPNRQIEPKQVFLYMECASFAVPVGFRGENESLSRSAYTAAASPSGTYVRERSPVFTFQYFESLLAVRINDRFSNESGDTAMVRLRLVRAPSSNVRIPIAIDDDSAGVITNASKTLLFTPANYSTWAFVEIAGVRNDDIDGTHWYNLLVGPASSRDPLYNRLPQREVELGNEDVLFPRIYAIHPSLSALGGGIDVTILGQDLLDGFQLQMTIYDNSTGEAIVSLLNSTVAELSEEQLWHKIESIEAVQGLVFDSILPQSLGGARTSSGSRFRELVFEAPPQQSIGYHSFELANPAGHGDIQETLYFTDECPFEGFFYSSGKCNECPDNAFCPGGRRVWPMPGFWNGNETNPQVQQCQPSWRCLGGRYSECAEGYTGPLCGECADGFYRLGAICQKCSGGSESFLYGGIYLGIIAILYCAAIFVKSNEAFDLIIELWFTLGMIRAVGQMASGNLPSFVQQFISRLSWVTFDIEFMKPGCGLGDASFEFRYYANFLLMLLLIIPCFVILPLLHWLRNVIEDWKAKKVAPLPDDNRVHVSEAVESMFETPDDQPAQGDKQDGSTSQEDRFYQFFNTSAHPVGDLCDPDRKKGYRPDYAYRGRSVWDDDEVDEPHTDDDEDDERIYFASKSEWRIFQRRTFFRFRFMRMTTILYLMCFIAICTRSIESIHCIEIEATDDSSGEIDGEASSSWYGGRFGGRSTLQTEDGSGNATSSSGTKLVLSTAPSVECFQGSHSLIFIVSLFALGLMFLIFGLFLRKIRNNILNLRPLADRYGTLFEAYHKKYYYFGFLALLTEFLIVLFYIILWDDYVIRFALVFATISGLMVFCWKYQPFSMKEENQYFVAVVFIGVLEAVMNLIGSLENQTSTTETIINILAYSFIGVIVIVLFMFVRVILTIYDMTWKELLIDFCLLRKPMKKVVRGVKTASTPVVQSIKKSLPAPNARKAVVAPASEDGEYSDDASDGPSESSDMVARLKRIDGIVSAPKEHSVETVDMPPEPSKAQKLFSTLIAKVHDDVVAEENASDSEEEVHSPSAQPVPRPPIKPLIQSREPESPSHVIDLPHPVEQADGEQTPRRSAAEMKRQFLRHTLKGRVVPLYSSKLVGDQRSSASSSGYSTDTSSEKDSSDPIWSEAIEPTPPVDRSSKRSRHVRRSHRKDGSVRPLRFSLSTVIADRMRESVRQTSADASEATIAPPSFVGDPGSLLQMMLDDSGDVRDRTQADTVTYVSRATPPVGTIQNMRRPSALPPLSEDHVSPAPLQSPLIRYRYDVLAATTDSTDRNTTVLNSIASHDWNEEGFLLTADDVRRIQSGVARRQPHQTVVSTVDDLCENADRSSREDAIVYIHRIRLALVAIKENYCHLVEEGESDSPLKGLYVFCVQKLKGSLRKVEARSRAA